MLHRRLHYAQAQLEMNQSLQCNPGLLPGYGGFHYDAYWSRLFFAFSVFTVLHCFAAGLAAASDQLPVVGDVKAQDEAQMLLEACQAAQIDAWVVPLALLLEDINLLAGGAKASELMHCASILV